MIDLNATVLDVVKARITRDFAEQIRECIGVLDEQQIWWRPNESANSVGNLILHLCGSIHYYVWFVVAGNEYDRDRPKEFSERGPIAKPDLVDRFNRTIDMVTDVLASFDPKRLTERTDRTGKDSSYARILLHVSHHVGAHTAQIVYITKALKEGAINELWMKTRGS